MLLNVYQARNGKIYIRNGSKSTALTKQQIEDLQLVVFELEDFDFDGYKIAYERHEQTNDKKRKNQRTI